MAALQEKWDNIYKAGLPSLTKADPFFVETYEQYIAPLYPKGGKALDLAAGLGRHSLWLAGQNWHTTAVDISPFAIETLQQAASTQNGIVETVISDAAAYPLPLADLDLVVLYYHFDRALFPSIAAALKPGGLLICKLAVSSSDSNVSPNSPLQKGEFLSLVTSFETIVHTERAVRDRGVAEYLGRRKSDPPTRAK